jgi:hypothetical protein
MVSMQSHVPKIAGSNPQICKMYGGKKEKNTEKKIFCLRHPGPWNHAEDYIKYKLRDRFPSRFILLQRSLPFKCYLGSHMKRCGMQQSETFRVGFEPPSSARPNAPRPPKGPGLSSLLPHNTLSGTNNMYFAILLIIKHFYDFCSCI